MGARAAVQRPLRSLPVDPRETCCEPGAGLAVLPPPGRKQPATGACAGVGLHLSFPPIVKDALAGAEARLGEGKGEGEGARRERKLGSGTLRALIPTYAPVIERSMRREAR
jgi:hypothetical protein